MADGGRPRFVGQERMGDEWASVINSISTLKNVTERSCRYRIFAGQF
jgi:hypothetical protein